MLSGVEELSIGVPVGGDFVDLVRLRVIFDVSDYISVEGVFLLR